MGLVYTVQMHNYQDWNYIDTDKISELTKFTQKIEYSLSFSPEIIASWPFWAVFDMGKYSNEHWEEIVLLHADFAFYWYDSNPHLIKRLVSK